MKYILTAVAALVAAAAFLYMLFAFGTWQFNPAYWSEGARVFCAIILGAGAFGCIAPVLIWLLEKE